MYENLLQQSGRKEHTDCMPAFFHGSRDGLLRCRVVHDGAEKIFIRRDGLWYEDSARGHYEIEQHNMPDDKDFSDLLEEAFINEQESKKTHETVEHILKDHGSELEALEERYRRMGVVD